jgi:hypothetical protein
MIDNRKKFRFLIPGSVVLRSVEDRPRIIKGQLVDFGKKGVGIHTETNLRKDMVVDFFLMNKDYEFSLKGTGRIKNVRPITKRDFHIYRVGMEFVTVDEKEILAIVDRLKTMGW